MREGILMYVLLWVVCLVVLPSRCHAQLTQAQERSVVEVTDSTKRMGTAWACSPHYLITAYHVVTGESAVFVRVDGVKHPASVVRISEKWDLALLHVPSLAFTPLPVAAG